MRVVSGKVKGTKLVAPKSEKTRPTLDKTKEALFSVLLHMVPQLFAADGQAVCLDLCAGSGQIGIEALSRNFQQATFVEAARAVKSILQLNLEKTHLTAQAVLLIKTVGSFLKDWTLQNEKQAYDFIYCDPPYALAATINAAVLEVAAQGLLSKEGILVLEQAADTATLTGCGSLKLVKEQVYGLTRLCFYRFSEIDQSA